MTMGLRSLRRGFALVAVLWLVAAVFVSVTGVLYAARGEIRSTAWHVELGTAAARSDAGTIIMLRRLAAAPDRSPLWRTLELNFDDRALRVTVVPLSGLIDVNAAPETLLADLLAVAGDIDRERAAALAQRIVDWRDPDDSPLAAGAEDASYVAAESRFRTRGHDFEAPEDLLQVLGFDFDLYAKVSKLVTVESRGSGRVNPRSAPPAILRVLASGNDALAGDYERARAADGVLADTTRFRADHVGNDVGTRYLLVVRAGLSNGASLVTRRFVDVGAVVNGIPWVTLRTERVVEEQDD